MVTEIRRSVEWEPSPARGWAFAAIAGLAFSLAACLPAQWEYLGQATGQATQQDVRERLGEPYQAKALDDQTQVWTYRYEATTWFSGWRGDQMGKSPCTEYVLTFDSKQVLSYWTRKPCGTL